MIAAFLSAVGPIVSSVAALIALRRERKHQSSKPNQQPALAFLSVFACGIAVTALLVTLIRPIPKIGEADFEIGSELDSKNQPVSHTPNCILFTSNGGDQTLTKIVGAGSAQAAGMSPSGISHKFLGCGRHHGIGWSALRSSSRRSPLATVDSLLREGQKAIAQTCCIITINT